MTKGKNKKVEIKKIDIFLLPPLSSQDGFFAILPKGGGGAATTDLE